MDQAVTVGLMIIPHSEQAEVAAAAHEAEAQGFDYVACGEHVLFHGPAHNAFVTLAAAAAVTRKIRLLSAVTLAPLYPPALLAKMAIALDRVSRGRFDLGVGVGGEYPAEFSACGVPLVERASRTDEFLELFSALVHETEVTFKGQYGSLEGQAINPPSVQLGGPPLWIGGRGRASIRRASRYGRYWFPYMITPQQFRTGLEEAQAQARQYGRGSRDLSGAVFAWASVHKNGRRARMSALDALKSVYGQDFKPILDRYVPAGDPKLVTERLQAYVDAGASSILVSPACEPQDLDRMVACFAEEVLPELRRANPAPSDGLPNEANSRNQWED